MPCYRIKKANIYKVKSIIIRELYLTSFFFIVSGALSILMLLMRVNGTSLFVQAAGGDNATAKLVCNPLGYIVVLRDNVSATPKTVSQEYEIKGVNVTHLYESVFRGFNIKIPENLCNTILNGLKNDLRIAYFEPDNITSIR
jgi:hypothetical protein